MTEERSERQQERYDSGCKMAQELTKALNVMGGEDDLVEGFVDGLIRSHRTLQASTIRVLMQVLRRYADDGGCDLRNEAAVEAARKMADAVEEHHIPFI